MMCAVEMESVFLQRSQVSHHVTGGLDLRKDNNHFIVIKLTYHTVSPFKVYNWMVFTLSTESVLEHFHHLCFHCPLVTFSAPSPSAVGSF